MAMAPDLVFGTAPEIGLVADTTGIDRLTVFATRVTIGRTAKDTSWTTGVAIEVTGLVRFATEVTGMRLDVELAIEERCRVTVPAGTTDPTCPARGEEGSVSGAALAEPASNVDRTKVKNMPAKMAMMTNAGRGSLRLCWGGSDVGPCNGTVGSGTVTSAIYHFE